MFSPGFFMVNIMKGASLQKMMEFLGVVQRQMKLVNMLVETGEIAIRSVKKVSYRLSNVALKVNVILDCLITKEEQCVFPFKYKGVSYDSCTTVDNNDKLWCSTKTDEDGKFISGFWVNCNDSCNGEPGDCNDDFFG